MRRGCSVILLVLGGSMLVTALLAAFIDVQPGLGDNLAMVGGTLFLALVPLLLGAALNPAQRWRDLGLTILVALAVLAAMAISYAAIFLDPAMTRYMPPMPPIQFNFDVGVAVTLIVAATGSLLYRQKSKRD